VILVGCGVVCLFFGYRAPPEKAQEAATAIHDGWGCIIAGAVMCIIRRFFCGFSD
jgi:hypothetical protein